MEQCQEVNVRDSEKEGEGHIGKVVQPVELFRRDRIGVVLTWVDP